MREVVPRIRATFRETPIVWLLGRPAGGFGDAVDPDNQRVGELAAEAVLDKGHRQVAIVNPKHDHSLFAIRGRAFRQVIERAGGTVAEFVPRSPPARFPLQPVMDVSQVQPLVDHAIEGLRRRTARGPRRQSPTAIFCPADSIAALVYRALAVRGLVAGRDVSVVSCNHERSLVAGLWPSLATVEVYPQRIGRMAVEQLTRRITGQFAGTAVQIGIEPMFVPGGSLGRC
jgi:DNA-binding LacI/PurR family transcriptional regulator